MGKLKIYYKQLFSFILIGVIPVIIIGSIAYVFCTNLLHDSLRDQSLSNVTKISTSLDQLTSELGEIIIYLLCEDQQIRKALQQTSDADFDHINKRIATLASRRTINIFVTDTSGQVNFSTCPVPEIYQVALRHGKGIFAAADGVKNRCIIYPNNHLNQLDDRAAFSLARTIRDLHDRPIGYVIVEVSKECLFSINHTLDSIYNMNWIILDPEHYILSNYHEPETESTIFLPELSGKLQAEESGVLLELVNQKWTLVAFHRSQYTKLTTVGTVPIDYVVENANVIKQVTIFACLLCLLFCLILASIMARNVSQPINELVQCMRQVEAGNLKARVELSSSDELGLLGKSFNKMVARLNSLINSITEKQERLKQAEIKALQAQINPHFLYNTLDTIKWLAKLDRIEELKIIVTELGKLLRNSISSSQEIITVEESIQFIGNYLKIQKIRYGDHLNITVNISPEINECRIPKLLLQPIVENAIIHGLEKKVGVGNLVINGRLENEQLSFEIIDDGVGIAAEKTALINAKIDYASTSASIGIQNVNRRIQLYYGSEYGLEIESQLGKGTRVTLRLPCAQKEGGEASSTM
jgi:two-component system sensor histidine kinase YesM